VIAFPVAPPGFPFDMASPTEPREGGIMGGEG
jgi:hypothetical protein